MAVIEKRGPLQWRARVRLKGTTSSKTFMSRADAETWSRETEVAISRGTWRDASSGQKPFREVAAKYLAEVTPTKKSGSREAYRIKALMQAPEFDRHISAIQAPHVAAYRDRRLKTRSSRAGGEQTLSTQTVLHELNTLSGIFEHARLEWSIVLAGNPVRDIRKPAQGRARDRRFSELELDYLRRSTAESVGLAEAFTLAIETSMRLGELLSLAWRDVDLDAQVAEIRDSKNGDARSVALSTRACAALRSLLPKETGAVPEPRGPTQQKALARAKKAGLVFHWAGSDSFDKTWRRALNRAREAYAADCVASGSEPDATVLADLRWHDIRHEAVSRLFELDLNPFEVASMSGHKSMQMLKRYTHTKAKKVAAKLG